MTLSVKDITRMNTRLKALRNAKNLSQTEFGSKVGLSASTISAIEAGKTPMNETNIKVFCSEYGVSEHWLRTGEGEMFLNGKEFPSEEELVGIYRQLTPPNRVIAVKQIDVLLESQNEGEKEEKSTGDITSKTG